MEAAMKLISLLIYAVLISGCANHTEDTVSPQITENESSVHTSEQAEEEQTVNGLEIQIGEQTFYAELYDTETAEEFAALLPMTIDMSELNGNEKYFYLDKSLTTSGSVPDRIHTGDIMLYGSNCLVLFYEDFSTSYSYTKIGYIENPTDFSEALGLDDVTVEFETDNGDK